MWGDGRQAELVGAVMGGGRRRRRRARWEERLGRDEAKSSRELLGPHPAMDSLLWDLRQVTYSPWAPISSPEK